MKRLILLVGVPGSGKTTLARKLIKKGFERLCADDIRHELYGDAAQQGDAKQVMSVFFKRLENQLEAGRNIVVDNMNVKIEHRKEIIDRAEQFKYSDIQLWVLDTPLTVCLERNKQRQRQVPEEVITRSFNTLTRYGQPRLIEGKVVRIKDNDNIDTIMRSLD